MAQRFRDFGASNIFDSSDMEPVVFRLDGETFQCKPALPGATLLKFIADADSGDGGRASDAIPRLFQHVMTETEYERFNTFVTRDDRIVSLETLTEVAAWLVEVYTERPTRGHSPSSTGIEVTAPPSVAGVSSMASS